MKHTHTAVSGVDEGPGSESEGWADAATAATDVALSSHQFPDGFDVRPDAGGGLDVPRKTT